VLAHDDLLGVGAALRRDRQVGHRGQPDSPARHREVVVDQVGGDLSGRGAALERRRLDHPVAELDRTERGRLEDVGGHPGNDNAF
jgi:hypothetical protein